MSRPKNRRTRRTVVAVAAAGATIATAVPAFADSGPVGVPVTVTTAAGTRQFAVETVTGAPLTALDLGQGGAAPFRVRVADNAYNPGTSNPFTVSAVMNNLYQLNSGGSGYAYNVSIPSSQAAITFPATPLSATGISIPFDPTLLLSGSLPTCSQLNNLLTASPVAGGGTPLSGLVGTVTGTALNALDPLCLALGGLLGTAQTAIPAATVTNTLQKTLSDALSSLNLGDLPVNLAAPATGASPFTVPDYANGIGAADTNKPASPAAATPVNLLSGSENVTAALQAIITNAYANIPLVGSGTTAGLAKADDVIAALRSTATGALANVLTQLSSSSNTAAVTDVLNALTAKLSPATIANILNLTGTYLSFPSINVTPPAGTSVGTYRGTMTVTYVQK